MTHDAWGVAASWMPDPGVRWAGVRTLWQPVAGMPAAIVAICGVVGALFFATVLPADESRPSSSLHASEATASQSRQSEAVFETSDGGVMPYLIYMPESDDDAKPLVVFLHGRGESDGPLSVVAKWGPPKFAARGDDLPFLLIAPQCPADDHWPSDRQLDRLDELIRHVTQSHAVDRRRIYLTGLSMGGYGSWALAARHPDRFAAVVPVCGKGDPATAADLVDVPIWAFHGTDDRVVPFAGSADAVAAIRDAGGSKIRFTTLEHVGHNSWSPAYATPDLWTWMLSHRLP